MVGSRPFDQSEIASVFARYPGVRAVYLDENTKARWIQMIGFRNVLVHAYLDIDYQVVYDVLEHHLGDIEELGRVFAQFLQQTA